MPLHNLALTKPLSPRRAQSTLTRVRPRQYNRNEKGAGMVEFSLIALPMILTGIGTVELTHWIYVRQAVGAALVGAAKAGSLRHANPTAIARAFEQRAIPLHTGGSVRTATQQLTNNQARAIRGQPDLAWHIQIRSPSTAVFNDFPKSRGGGTPNYRAIGNSYQREQHLKAKNNGWTNGVGPTSKETIFQANTLTLLLTYQYVPLVPGLSALAPGPLLIRREVQVTMQSDPILWSDSANAQVNRKPWQGSSTHIPNENNSQPAEGSSGGSKNAGQQGNKNEAEQPGTVADNPLPENNPNGPDPESVADCLNGEAYRPAKYVQRRHPLSPSPAPNAHAPLQRSFRNVNRVPRLPTHCFAS
tara:strand:- start:109481 stop:110557 length:1077 start_codon:yes stop_codon:yes gene_type:complete